MDQPESEFPDVPGEGMFRALELDEEQAEAREAEHELSHSDLAEYARQTNAERRRLAQENEELRARLGIEPGAELGGVETGSSEAPQVSRGNLGDEVPVRLGNSAAVNDLVLEAVRETVIQLLPELLREALPRPRAIEVFIPAEGRARVDALEVVSRTYSSLVDTVAQLAARSTRVPTEDGFYSFGINEEVASLLAQVGMASPRRPKSVSYSRSVLWLWSIFPVVRVISPTTWVEAALIPRPVINFRWETAVLVGPCLSR